MNKTREIALTLLTTLFTTALFLVEGCSEWRSLDNRERGAIIGGASGAAVGSAIGDTPGALIGGAAGVIGGGAIGDNIDDDRRRRRDRY